jgi:DtxR family Mn-dependent transcriptional regulator
MDFSKSEENYLKAIYHLELQNGGSASTSKISEVIDTKAASVTEMVKKLSEKQLVDYRKYHGTTLTESGRRQALKIIRKHRLWELFLVEKLGFNWDEVHEVAEQLEHIKSEKLTDAIDKLLSYPSKDPHGDPIPDKNGNVIVRKSTLLSSCQLGDSGIIVGVKDSSPEFLRYLDKVQINIGTRFSITDIEAFDHLLDLRINHTAVKISQKSAKNLYVEIT